MSAQKKPQSGAAERLEVPTVDPLERRLNVFANSQAPPPSRPIIAPVPKSALLSRLANFLPQMEAANQRLQVEMQDRPPEEFNVENVPEDQQEGYIEMDLACGVLDLKDDAALHAAEAALAGQRPDLLEGLSPEDVDDSETDDSSDSDASCSEEDGEAAAGAEAVEGGNSDEEMQDEAGVSGEAGVGQGQTPAAFGVRPGIAPAARKAGRRVVKARRSGTAGGRASGKAKPKIVEL